MTVIKKETAEGIVAGFLASYKRKPAGQPVGEWLDAEFAKYPEIWADEAERRAYSADVMKGIEDFQSEQKTQEAHVASGGSRASYIEDVLTRGCKAEGVVLTAKYAAGIDQAVGEANKLMASQVFTHKPDGTLDFTHVSEAPTLEGNIAEAHHAGSFNIDAAAKESGVRAEVPASHGKNSVDILIKDADGKVLRKYQSKYGANSKATETQFGNRYPGQRKLAPEEQAEEIPGATDHIEADGVKSKPLSKEEAVRMKEEAQKTGKPKEYDWNDANAKVVCKHIGKKAAVAGLLAVGFQGARIVGRRIWNGLTGKKNKSVSEDFKEFATSAAKSGATAAGMAALSGGLVVAAKKGLLGAAVKSVRGNVIANVACAAVENLKIVRKLGSGEISGVEALDLAGRTNCSLVGSLALGAKGAAVGATIGMALGPVGAAVGGFIGGVAGCITGSVVGEAVYAGAKKVCKAVCSVASACIKTVGRTVGRVARALNPLNWF